MRLWEVSDGYILQEGHAATQLGMETVLRKFQRVKAKVPKLDWAGGTVRL